MQREVVLSTEERFDLWELVSAFRRRYLYLLVTAAAAFAAVVFVAKFVLQNQYQATARILIESQQVPTDLASSVIKASPEERIELIHQRLLTRNNVLEVADKFDLYPESRAKLAPEVLVELIDKATDIQQIAVSMTPGIVSDKQPIGFTVSFKYSDPVVASNVVNQFVESILQRNAVSRETRATETSNFFQQQVKKLGVELADLDVRIADFKKAHAGTMPDTIIERRRELAQLRTTIAQIDRRLALRTDQQQVTSSKERIVLLNSKLETAKQQLQVASDQRLELLPLVGKGYITRARIIELDKDVAALKGTVRETSASIDIETSKLEESTNQLDQLPKQRTELAERAEILQQAILKTPEVEAAYNALMREHNNMQVEYDTAKENLAKAATGEQLEEDRQAERFEVVERASVPRKPLSPNRRRIVFLGALGSIAAGIGMVFLVEGLDNSIYSPADLERKLRVRPFATIPYLETSAERKWKARALSTLINILIGILALILVALYKFDQLMHT